jgi:hypothetical protein
MSGYLSRLITRSHPSGEPQPLPPFVRSTSPIAEQDQRLGVAGFETADTAMLPQPEINTGGLTPTEGAPTVAPPAITPADGVTIQRKQAGAAAGSQPSAPLKGINNLSYTAPKQETTDGFLVQSPQNRQPELEPNQESALTKAFQRPVEPPPGPEPPPLISHQPLSPIPEMSPGVTGKNPGSDIEFKPVARGRETLDYPQTDPNPPGSPNPDPNLPGSPDIVSVVPSENFPTLIPLEQPPEGLEKPVVEASSAANEHQPAAPRVVIGRINVEVVPQKTPEATVSTAKPGPLTANSVSVIGPLRGRMPANLRLSLRQR